MIKIMKNVFNGLSRYIFFLFICIPYITFAQADSNEVLTFDFNDHEIKEKDNKVIPKFVGVSLVKDRFGNERSAAYTHGHSSSYLNLGSSELLKPKHATISLWVNIERRIYTGKGYDSNPIIRAKNGPGDDFINAYAMGYECYSQKIGASSSKDSTKDVNAYSILALNFNDWYHLVITFDSNYFALYVNGELQEKFSKGFETSYLSGDSVMVGHSANKKNERFTQASFDDIQIFHRVLSEKEIKELYQSPNPNAFKNTLNEVLKYGSIILVLIIVIIILIIRNKRNLKKQKEQFDLINKVTALELKVIKAQMNPHFISNCLAAIQELIYKNNIEKAGQYIAKFSYFLRQVLNFSDKDYVTLSEELEIIKLNIELEQLRFKNEFNFELNVSKEIDVKNVLIPTMITQPFIENAIWHGLLPLGNSRHAALKINIRMEAGLIKIEIEDNGVGRDLNKTVNPASKGTKLVTDKLEILNRLSNTLNHKIEIIDLVNEYNIQTGTKIIIKLDNIKE